MQLYIQSNSVIYWIIKKLCLKMKLNLKVLRSCLKAEKDIDLVTKLGIVVHTYQKVIITYCSKKRWRNLKVIVIFLCPQIS